MKGNVELPLNRKVYEEYFYEIPCKSVIIQVHGTAWAIDQDVAILVLAEGSLAEKYRLK